MLSASFTKTAVHKDDISMHLITIVMHAPCMPFHFILLQLLEEELDRTIFTYSSHLHSKTVYQTKAVIHFPEILEL